MLGKLDPVCSGTAAGSGNYSHSLRGTSLEKLVAVT